MATISNLLRTDGKQTHKDIQSDALEMIDYLVSRSKQKYNCDTYSAKANIAAWLYPQIGVENLKKSFRQLSQAEYEKAIAVCFPHCEHINEEWNT